ncbi:hypothetical protein [Bacillus sp. RO1]|uniref:hypothetical protein n=1 Tax=Bacillus sp. RO1 TaxID=2722703 RepID=UPI0014568DA1|nr:hypothetical protein [Bacillus sp. RO1]NLP52036.1 hypothetical protein [Bacillus sp. RO1]
MGRKELIKIIAETYFKYLQSLDFNNEYFMAGAREGKRKFLANLHIYLINMTQPRGWKDRRYSTDYITINALEILRNKSCAGLVYEHIVPKTKYIQEVCEHRAREKTLTIEFIITQLDRYLWTATITEKENERLNNFAMPDDWDLKNIMARYEEAGIELVIHNKDYMLKKGVIL